MGRARWAAVIAALLAAACSAAAQQWTKPGASPADVERDAEACAHEAASALSARGARQGQAARGGAEALRQREIADSCLETKGYERRR